MSRGRFGRGSWHENTGGHIHVRHRHTIKYSSKTKTDICQEGRKSFTYLIKKITGSKTKVLEHVIDSGLERALEVFEQRQEDTWHKTTPETMSPFAVMNMVWSDEGIKKLRRRGARQKEIALKVKHFSVRIKKSPSDLNGKMHFLYFPDMEKQKVFCNFERQLKRILR